MSSLHPRIHEDGRSRLVAYDHGAHLASWDLDGSPVVWLSPHAVLDGSTALRGGIPLCFPWFGSGPSGDLSPGHGVARTATWTYYDAPGHGSGEVWAWTLTSEDVAGAPGAEHLPGPFVARYAVALDGTDLRLTLTVGNPGSTAYRMEAALHTYLAVPDAREARVHGLDGVDHLDKVTGRREVQDGPVRFDGQTDRVYDSPGTHGLRLEHGAGAVALHPTGATQVVVWNPGEEVGGGMGDVREAWSQFVCVETAATGDRALELPAGGEITLTCTLTVEQPPSS